MRRIGQDSAIKDIQKEWSNDKRGNRFIILVGAQGSGKSLIAREVASKMIRVEVVGTVAEIRKAVSLAYKVAEPTVYIIDKGDELSPAAKNTLLKITEEPPNKARFILEVRNESAVLGTLLSRGKVVRLEPYTYAQIQEYIKETHTDLDDNKANLLADCCITPGLVETVLEYDIETFYKFAENIVLHIQEVSDTNAFKSASAISFKQGEEGYSVDLLFDILKITASRVLRAGLCNNTKEHVRLVRAISKYGRMLKATGINKKAVYDMFLLEVRGNEPL